MNDVDFSNMPVVNAGYTPGGSQWFRRTRDGREFFTTTQALGCWACTDPDGVKRDGWHTHVHYHFLDGTVAKTWKQLVAHIEAAE